MSELFHELLHKFEICQKLLLSEMRKLTMDSPFLQRENKEVRREYYSHPIDRVLECNFQHDQASPKDFQVQEKFHSFSKIQ